MNGVNGHTDSVDGRRNSHFVANEDVRVIVVSIKDVRISDFKGAVNDFTVEPPSNGTQ